MAKNYFSIERAGKCICPVVIEDEDGIAFEDWMDMSYEEMKAYKEIGLFIDCVMDATNAYFDENDDQTIVTLIGEDDMFIWSILIGPMDDPTKQHYGLVDWRKDGKFYKYED